MINVGVTGYTGFVGTKYMRSPLAGAYLIGIDLRNQDVHKLDLSEIDVIVHLAGKAHEMRPIPDHEYFDVNVEMTKALADNAKASGVTQFVYISSTKVYGDETGDMVFNEGSVCEPTDAYGKSKYQAEQYLLSLRSDSFKVAIIRPPLVYGPDVKGNMIKLLRLADRNIPLPLGKTGNRRSMVYVGNLIALINKVITEKASGIFIAGDRAPVATDTLLYLIRKSMGNRSALISLHPSLRVLLRILKPALHIRLFGSFVVDNTTTNRVLHFDPPFSTGDGVADMVSWYKTIK